MAGLKTCLTCNKPVYGNKLECRHCATTIGKATYNGKRFGKTTVTNYLSRRRVICLCDCGTIHETRIDHLIKKQKSCGCIRPGSAGKNNKRYRKELHHPIFKGRFVAWRDGASKRNITFELTMKDLEILFEQQRGRCFYSGVLLELEPGYDRTISLERINSDKDYTTDNVVFITSQINKMKRHYPLDAFLSVCKDVVKYSNTESAEDFNEAV